MANNHTITQHQCKTKPADSLLARVYCTKNQNTNLETIYASGFVTRAKIDQVLLFQWTPTCYKERICFNSIYLEGTKYDQSDGRPISHCGGMGTWKLDFELEPQNHIWCYLSSILLHTFLIDTDVHDMQCCFS